jgi:hypothetical protein
MYCTVQFALWVEHYKNVPQGQQLHRLQAKGKA